MHGTAWHASTRLAWAYSGGGRAEGNAAVRAGQACGRIWRAEARAALTQLEHQVLVDGRRLRPVDNGGRIRAYSGGGRAEGDVAVRLCTPA